MANDLTKLLDNGWTVSLFRNALGSYTAKARSFKTTRKEITDDFTVDEVLTRITDKCLGLGDYRD